MTTEDRRERLENDLAWIATLGKADMRSCLSWLVAYDPEAVKLLRERLGDPKAGT